jgi:fatty acid desaturase
LHFICCAEDYGANYPIVRSGAFQERKWFHKYQGVYAPLWMVLQPSYTIKQIILELQNGWREKDRTKIVLILLFSSINPWLPILPFLCVSAVHACLLVLICNTLSNLLFIPYHVTQHFLGDLPELSQADVNSFDFLEMQIRVTKSLRSNFFLDNIVGLVDPGLHTEHHILPGAPFPVLHRLTEILEEKKLHGFRVLSWFEAWNGIISKLHQLGQKNSE